METAASTTSDGLFESAGFSTVNTPFMQCIKSLIAEVKKGSNDVVNTFIDANYIELKSWVLFSKYGQVVAPLQQKQQRKKKDASAAKTRTFYNIAEVRALTQFFESDSALHMWRDVAAVKDITSFVEVQSFMSQTIKALLSEDPSRVKAVLDLAKEQYLQVKLEVEKELSKTRCGASLEWNKELTASYERLLRCLSFGFPVVSYKLGKNPVGKGFAVTTQFDYLLTDWSVDKRHIAV